jgi:hypothetical protein
MSMGFPVALANHMRVSWFGWLATPSWKPAGTILVSVRMCLLAMAHTFFKGGSQATNHAV